MRVGRWTIPFGHFEWPHGGSSAGQIFGMVAACLGILFAAFGEELFFRSWMTQTLGQYVRFPTIVVAIVAVLFSAAHTQYDWPLKIVMLICSVGFSVLSLRDQRLELAVGAHSMMNICAMLQSVFFAGSLSYAPASAALSAHTPAFVFDGFSIAILKGVLPFVLMYLVLQKTNGWFPSKDALHEAT
jgi:membrane protease YdiL (CAAX protease family)